MKIFTLCLTFVINSFNIIALCKVVNRNICILQSFTRLHLRSAIDGDYMAGEIGKRMFEIMERKHIKSRDLCELLQLKESSLSSWKARGKDPDAKDIFAICELLDVSCEYLLTGKEAVGSDDTSELVEIYQNLNNDGRRILMGKALDLKYTHTAENYQELKEAK